ncbi:MAG: NADH-quinone oxidoreductase subunit NuoF [Bacteroidales bacterium]|nr:NADH-quinone oxidoreductase subunit NuoF [Bacteroidales bacterium]
MNITAPLIALRRMGKVSPHSIDDFIANQGFEGFKKALHISPSEVIAEVEKSGLRGRGGAGFPTSMKQQFTATSCSTCTTRYIVCNADEGEPGTFKDRMIMETDPFVLIEGMMIAGYAIGAHYGYIYIRGEYESSIQNLSNAIKQAYEKGFLGKNILGSSFSFEMDIFLGAGSYLCGEELTLIESLEGKRGYPRIKPPFPAEKGLWGLPTLVNNVETFAHLPFILEKGYEQYASIGTAESKGTKLFCVSGKVKKSGVFELPLGVTLRSLIFDTAGGMKDGYQFKGALLGGAAGTFVDETMLDVPLAYETLKQKGATLGSGAVIVVDNKTNMKEMMQSILSFFKHESCGKCVPCRIGTTLLYNKIHQTTLNEEDLNWMLEQALYMQRNSLCPLGQSPILPIKSVLTYFKTELL